MIYLKNNTKKQTFYIRRNFDWNFNVVPFKRQEKDFTATRNGNYTILADDDYTVMTQVNLEVALPFEEKTVDITEDGTTEILPSKDYDGMSKVTINTNTQGKIDPVKSETYTKNGKYQVRPSEGQYGIAGVDVEVALPFEERTIELKGGGTTIVEPTDNAEAMSKVTINVLNYSVSPSQTLDITKNGIYEIKPEEGFDGLFGATVNVKLPIEDNKNLNITRNGKITVLPDEGYDYLKKVELDVLVPSSVSGSLDLTGTGWENERTFPVNIERISAIESDLDYTRIKYSEWNSENTSADNLFKNDRNLIYCPAIDTHNVTSMRDMFYGTWNVYALPSFDCSNCQDMYSTFSSCELVEKFPDMDTRKVENFEDTFVFCRNMKYVPNIITSNAINLKEMFRECNSIETVYSLDTQNALYLARMFKNCYSLREVALFDTSKVLDLDGIFLNCSSLTTLGGFKDLKTSLYLRDCPLLTHQSLMNVINNCGNAHPDFEAQPVLNLGEKNLAKLTEEEIAIAINKGWIVER